MNWNLSEDSRFSPTVPRNNDLICFPRAAEPSEWFINFQFSAGVFAERKRERESAQFPRPLLHVLGHFITVKRSSHAVNSCFLPPRGLQGRVMVKKKYELLNKVHYNI